MVGWAVTFERIGGVVEHVVRQDPVLPRNVIGDGWNNRLKGVTSTDAHVMDYEWGREGRVFILDTKGNHFPMELLKIHTGDRSS